LDLPTVHVVDDDAGLRDSLRLLLEASGLSVATYETATEFFSAATDLAGGCLLTDIRMPGLDGLELQEQLAARPVRLPVIVMTGHGDVPLAVRAMKAGAVDFLEKPFTDVQLLTAVGRALEQSREARELGRLTAEVSRMIAQLTPREREVLAMLIGGSSTKEIASRLGTSPRTIEVHRGRVFEKLRAGSLPDLVRISIAAGVRPVGSPIGVE